MKEESIDGIPFREVVLGSVVLPDAVGCIRLITVSRGVPDFWVRYINFSTIDYSF